MAFMDVIYQGFLDTILMNNFDRLPHSETFTKEEVNKVHKHPALRQDFSEPVGHNTHIKIEDKVEGKYERKLTH